MWQCLSNPSLILRGLILFKCSGIDYLCDACLENAQRKQESRDLRFTDCVRTRFRELDFFADSKYHLSRAYPPSPDAKDGVWLSIASHYSSLTFGASEIYLQGMEFIKSWKRDTVSSPPTINGGVADPNWPLVQLKHFPRFLSSTDLLHLYDRILRREMHKVRCLSVSSPSLSSFQTRFLAARFAAYMDFYMHCHPIHVLATMMFHCLDYYITPAFLSSGSHMELVQYLWLILHLHRLLGINVRDSLEHERISGLEIMQSRQAQTMLLHFLILLASRLDITVSVYIEHGTDDIDYVGLIRRVWPKQWPSVPVGVAEVFQSVWDAVADWDEGWY